LSRQLRRKSSSPRSRATAGSGERREFVQALERGFAVIKAFSASSPSLSMAEVAERAGLARAVARRYLLTLRDLQCVQEHDGRFMLTPRVLELGFAYLSTASVATLAQQTLESVRDRLGESCSLAVLDERDIVYIARAPAKRIMSINLGIGSRLPAHATSMGKVLLANLTPDDLHGFFSGPRLEMFTKRTVCDEAALRRELAQVRVRGWAQADGEIEIGLRSLAAPLWDHNGRVCAAMNISAHASRVGNTEFLRDHLPVLLDAARNVSKLLTSRVV
jgi:IclR family pca regulon transcriptional regulator